MNKKAAVLAAVLALAGTSAMAADLDKVDLGGEYWYAGQQQTATHEQVLQNIKELNEMVDKDYGLKKSGLATGFKQFREKFDTIYAMAGEVPKYGDKLQLALVGAMTKGQDMLAKQFGIAPERVGAVYEAIRADEAGTAKLNMSDFSKNEQDLIKASTAAYKARQMQTHLMTALPKAADTVNKAIDQVNKNTKELEGKAAQAEVTNALADKADKKAVEDELAAKANAADVDTKLEAKADKADVDAKLAKKADADNVYTKAEADDKLADKANAADVYTKTDVDGKLEVKADKSDVDAKLAKKADADNVYTKAEADDKLKEKANAADVYTKTDVDGKLEAKADAADVDAKLAKKADAADVDTKLAKKADADNVYTKAEVDKEFIKKANASDVAENAKKIEQGIKDMEQAKTDVAANKKAIAGNTEAIAGVTKELKQVDARVTAVDHRVDKVGALSGALAGLKPMQYDPLAPTQFMGAISTYEGEQGYALGVVHYTKEDVMLHGGIAYDGDSDIMGNIGVTVKVGSSADKAAIPARYQAGPISSIYVMQQENEQMQKDNAALQQRVAELERMVRELAAR